MTMEPGRELDVSVARDVIGVDNMDFCCPDCGGHHFGTDSSGPIAVRVCHGPPASCGWTGPAIEAPPEYSTDIAAAWQALEKLRADGKPLYVIPYKDGWMVGHDNGEGYVTHQDTPYTPFGGVVDSHLFDSATADTVQHAICLAVLKTIAK